MASPLFVLGAALLLSLLNGTTAAQGTHAEDCQPDESGLLQVQSRRMDAPVDCFKAAVLHFVDNPFDAKYAEDESGSYEFFADGMLVVAAGHVKWVGERSQLPEELAAGCANRTTDFGPRLITPGFIDNHAHASQQNIIASFGKQLLPWLTEYVFPGEAKFSDPEYAEKNYADFLDSMLRAGSTSGLLMATVSKTGTDILFRLAHQRNMRIIAGKVLQNTNSPPDLNDTAGVEAAINQSAELIEKWHGRGRLQYAVTPRFAAACTWEMLVAAGKLLRSEKYKGLHMHTHLCENLDEVATVLETFGEKARDETGAASYSAVYENAGLLNERSHMAHSIHIGHRDMAILRRNRATIAHCPTSNNFLGSGLFNFRAVNESGVRIGFGTDVGGGTGLSLLRSLGESYKVSKLGDSWFKQIYDQWIWPARPNCTAYWPECDVPPNDIPLSGPKGWYLPTLGSATALGLQDKVGSFSLGNEADFVVWDWRSPVPSFKDNKTLVYTELTAENLWEALFKVSLMGTAENVDYTYLMGKQVYAHDKEAPWPGTVFD